MSKKTTYYWNNPKMALRVEKDIVAGGRDIVDGEPIPEKFIEAKPKLFAQLCKDLHISTKQKVKFTEKKQIELNGLHGEIDKLRPRVQELLREKSELQKKVDDHTAIFEDFESIEAIKEALGEIGAYREAIKQLEADKKELGERFADLEGKFETLKGEKSALEGEKTTLVDKIKTLGDEKAGLELDNEGLKTEKAAWEKTKTSKKELGELLKAAK